MPSGCRFRKCRVIATILLSLTTIIALEAAVWAEVRGEGAAIRSGAEIDYPPFSLVDADGRVGGFSVELIRAALKTMGRDVEFRTGIWADVQGWLARGDVDVLPLVGRTPEREEVFDFTFPYMTLHGAIVVREETTDIRILDDLKGRRVAVMKGDNAEEFLRREERGIEIQTTPSFETALDELSRGLHDAVVVQRLVALRLIQKTGLKNLKIVEPPIEGFNQNFCFAVRKGDRKTLALLNEGLALVMADGTFRHLHSKWFAALELPTHRRIVIGGDDSYPPYEYLDDKGRPAGYNVDLTRALAREMGLDIEIRLGPWTEIRERLVQGEIDALQGMFYSTRRDLTFDFTSPHTINHYVGIVRRGEGTPPETLADLAGKRVAVQRGDIMQEFLAEMRFQGTVCLVDEQEKALRELAEGRYDCILATRLTAMHWIKMHGWNTLVVGWRPILSPGYGYAAMPHSKALLAELGEGLKVLEETGEYRRIHEKWLGVHEHLGMTITSILRWIAIFFTPMLLLLLIFFLWTWSLRRQVTARTAALQRSEEQYRLLADNTLDAIWTMNLDFEFTYINPACLALTGYTPEEWIGTRLPDHCDEATFMNLERVIGEELAKGPESTGVTLEAEMRRKNGDRIPVEIHGKVIHDDNGRPLQLQGVAREISERKRAESKLRESERRFRLLVESSPDAIYVWIEGRFAYLNITAVRLFGASASHELTGAPHLDRIPIEFRDIVRNRLRRLIQDKAVMSALEEVYLRMDGSFVSVEVSAVPIRYEGSDGALVFVRDISERVEREKANQSLQKQLLQAQKMESVGRLAGGVAHDFNNMLSVITGYAEMALDQSAPEAPVRAELEEILLAARRSADITRQLLAFARRQTVAPKVLDMNGIVESMLKLLRRLIGEDIDLVWLPGTALWPVKIDPAQVDQIMANLCVNARDAIAGVGRILIETKNMILDEAYCADHAGFVPGEYVMLVVNDDGRGMSPETLSRLFEPFFTTKEVGQGTGLGLATVYGIVKQNGGFINVYSEPGSGAIIKIYLPRHLDDAVETPEERMPEIPPGGDESLLLVEDEAAILKLGARMLQGMGYTVLSAGTPGQALDLALQHPGKIDLLITDVILPEMNGRELSGRLRFLFPGLKTLFMSGYTADIIAHRGFLDDGVCFIQKPFSRQDLAAKVREALDSAEPEAH